MAMLRPASDRESHLRELSSALTNAHANLAQLHAAARMTGIVPELIPPEARRLSVFCFAASYAAGRAANAAEWLEQHREIGLRGRLRGLAPYSDSAFQEHLETLSIGEGLAMRSHFGTLSELGGVFFEIARSLGMDVDREEVRAEGEKFAVDPVPARLAGAS